MIRFEWLAGNALVALTAALKGEPERFLPILVRVEGSKLVTQKLPQSKTQPRLSLSPSRSAAVVGCDDTLYVVKSSGIDASVNTESLRPDYEVLWSTDGTEPYLAIRGKGEGVTYYALGRTGLTQLDKKPSIHGEGPWTTVMSQNASLKLVTRNTEIKRSNAAATVKNLWIESAGEKASGNPGLVCGDVTAGEISPTGDAVLYITADGAAFIRALVPVDIELLTRQRESAMRSYTLSLSKQIGLALLIYSMENDSRLAETSELVDRLRPLLGVRNEDMLARFQYTFSGESLNNIESPDKTVLGYLPGTGGFTVVYADGHTQWQSELP